MLPRHVLLRPTALLGLLLVVLMAGCGAALDGTEPEPPEISEATFLIDDAPVDLQYELRDGLMVFEEDIVLDPESVLPDEAQPDALFSVKASGKLWPRGRVPFKIHSSVTNPGTVRKAMREWEEKTNIRFVPRDGEAAFVLFKEEPGNTVCRANVGYTGGRRIVYLRDTSLRSPCNLGVIVHEIGHTLGLWHEHTRDDRDQYVRVIWDNVGARSAFTKMTTGVRKLGRYDINSTMHYRSFTYSRPSNKASIVKKDGSLILHDWASLSAKDIAGMATLYPPRGEAVTAEAPPEPTPAEVEEPTPEYVEVGLAPTPPVAVEFLEHEPAGVPAPAVDQASQKTPEAPEPGEDGARPRVIDAEGGCSTPGGRPSVSLWALIGAFLLTNRRRRR